MLTQFPQAVPEIPVCDVDKAAEYYANVLGFNHDWGNDAGGIGGISQGDCRMFLTNATFRAAHGPSSPVIVWLNLNSKEEVDELFAAMDERWGRDCWRGWRTNRGTCGSSASRIRTPTSCGCSTISTGS